MERARGAIRALMDLTPGRGARARRGAGERARAGRRDRGRRRRRRASPGEKIPLDGAVVAGESDVNQAPVTGESLPVEKAPGDEVFAGTINGRGALDVRVTRLRARHDARAHHPPRRARAGAARAEPDVRRSLRARLHAGRAGARGRSSRIVPPLALRRELERRGSIARWCCSSSRARARSSSRRRSRSSSALAGGGAQGRADQGRRAPRARWRRALRRVRQDRHADPGQLRGRRRRAAERRCRRTRSCSSRRRSSRARSIRSAARSSRTRATRRHRARAGRRRSRRCPGCGAEGARRRRAASCSATTGCSRSAALLAGDARARSSALAARRPTPVHGRARRISRSASSASPTSRAKSARDAVELLREQGVEHVVLLTGDHEPRPRALAAAARRRRRAARSCCPRTRSRRSRSCGARYGIGGDGRRRRQRRAGAGGRRRRHRDGRRPAATPRSRPPTSR